MKLRAFVPTFALCAAFSFVLTGCDTPETKEASYLKKGDAFLTSGELEKARIEYKNAARINPTDAAPVYKLGLVDEAQGDLRQAFANFTSAEQQNAHYYPAVLKVAQYYLSADMVPDASKRVTAVLSEDPANAEAHALLAALLLKDKKFEDSEKEALFALQKDEKNLTAYSTLTGVYSGEENYDKAVATVNAGIEHSSNNLSLLLLRVMLYEHMNDIAKTDQAYQAIFKAYPDLPKYRLDLVSLYLELNKIDEAEATLRDAEKAIPNDWVIKHELVNFMAEHRSVQQGEQEISRLMQVYPSSDDLVIWQADLYARYDRPDEAAKLLEQIISRNNSSQASLNAQNSLAQLSYKQGNRDTAESLVTTVLSKKPDDSFALLMRASLSFDDGFYQKAVSDLRTVIRDQPTNEVALHLLAETFFLQGRLDLAIDTYKKLVDLRPNNFEAWVRLAQITNLNGDNKHALELIGHVTEVAPNYPVGWESAARLAIDAQAWASAEAAISALDKIPDQQPMALFLTGQILEKNGKLEEAITKYTEILSSDASSPLAEHVLQSYVDSEQKLGHVQAAIHFLEMLKADTPFIETLLGACYLEIGNQAKAEAEFNQAIAKKPHLQDPYIYRAQLYLKSNDTAQAINLLRQGVEVAPSDFRASLLEADALTSAGKYKEAITVYGDILQRSSAFDVAANNMAGLIANYQFNDSAALDQARQLAERFADSKNPIFLDTLAWVYYRQGKLELAETIMAKAFKQPAELPPEIHYHYGMIYKGLGKNSQARSELILATKDASPYPGIEEAKSALNEQ